MLWSGLCERRAAQLGSLALPVLCDDAVALRTGSSVGGVLLGLALLDMRGAPVVGCFSTAKDQSIYMLDEPFLAAADLLAAVAADPVVKQEQLGCFLLVDLLALGGGR